MRSLSVLIICSIFFSSSLGESKCQSHADRHKATQHLLKLVESETEEVSTVRRLLKAGANLEAHSLVGGVSYYTPLQWSAYRHHWETVMLLVKRGANVNLKVPFGDEHYYSPLALCARFGPSEVLKLLIAHGAKVNDQNNHHAHTPLMCAASEGKIENVKVLLKQGAKVNSVSWLGKATALSMAEERGHTAIARLLRCWKSRKS